MEDPQLPPVRTGTPARRSEAGAPPAQRAPGVRGFRDIAADADDLGRLRNSMLDSVKAMPADILRLYRATFDHAADLMHHLRPDAVPRKDQKRFIGGHSSSSTT